MDIQVTYNKEKECTVLSNIKQVCSAYGVRVEDLISFLRTDMGVLSNSINGEYVLAGCHVHTSVQDSVNSFLTF